MANPTQCANCGRKDYENGECRRCGYKEPDVRVVQGDTYSVYFCANCGCRYLFISEDSNVILCPKKHPLQRVKNP